MSDLTPADGALAQKILLAGHKIRQLSAEAPFFGPRIAKEKQDLIWAEIDQWRTQLSQDLDALCPAPVMRAMLQLEAEGCSENFHNSLNALHGGKAPAYHGDTPLNDDEKEILERETRVFLSRVLALRGNPDPDHGVEDFFA